MNSKTGKFLTHLIYILLIVIVFVFALTQKVKVDAKTSKIELFQGELKMSRLESSYSIEKLEDEVTMLRTQLQECKDQQ